MNNRRRKELKAQIKEIGRITTEISAMTEAQFKGEYEFIYSDIEFIKDELEWIKDEEEMAFDNMPDSLKESDRGYSMESNVEYLYEAVEYFEEILDDENTQAETLKDRLDKAVRVLEDVE